MKLFRKNRLLYFGLFLGVWGFSFININETSAQIPTVRQENNIDGTTRPTATGILGKRTINSRLFGTTNIGGAIMPNQDRPSRFQSGAISGSSGNFIGFDDSLPFSRFNSYHQRQFESNVDYDIYLLYRYYWENKEPTIIGKRPQSVSAKPQSPFPYQTRSVNPLLAQENVLTSPESLNSNPIIPENVEESIRTESPQQIWMRQASRSQNSNSFSSSPRNSTSTNHSNPSNLNSAASNYDLESANRLAENGTNELRFANQPNQQPFPLILPTTPNQTQQNPLTAYQEYLELMLLRSPDVNPLSPIQIQYNPTTQTATVRGIVPAQVNKIAAGKILLTDPRVKMVDNQLSTVPADLQGPLPTFDPNVR
ncbi:MAG: hypothetical protein Q4C95_03040 [Planctomycetia bacterium]|nr:hypothetical protein [Planctomycetia bacterium]